MSLQPIDPAPRPATKEPVQPSDKKLSFLLSWQPGETWPEFKARAIQAAREAGMVKDKAN